MAIQIRCVNKLNRSNPHERITHIGGIENGQRWRVTQEQGIVTTEAAARRGEYAFFVERGGSRSNVIVGTHNGHKYLTTTPDGEKQDNLLSLPECPAM